MWLTQVQFFKITDDLLDYERLSEQLQPLAFTPCLPSLGQSAGWVAPQETGEEQLLVERVPGYYLICMQIEEKILPSVVISQTARKQQVEQEAAWARKLSNKEKKTLKEEVKQALLLKAFTRLTRCYAYIDIENKWLVLGATQKKKVESFINLFKKTTQDKVTPISVERVSAKFTHWLHNAQHLDFEIEKAAVLRDPRYNRRVIRCQEQDLLDPEILGLCDSGCEVEQIAISWKNRMKCSIRHDLVLSGIKYLEATRERDGGQEEKDFYTDFLLCADTISSVFSCLFSTLSA